MSSGTDPFSGSSLVDRGFGTAFDTVKTVSGHLSEIKHVSAHMAEIYRLSASIDAIDSISFNLTSLLNISQARTIPTSTSPGAVGEYAWDSDYEYRCIAPNTWKRIPLTSW